jgi:hypothetical protein
VSKELVPSRRGLVEASIQNHIDMQKKTNSKLEMLKKKVRRRLSLTSSSSSSSSSSKLEVLKKKVRTH